MLNLNQEHFLRHFHYSDTGLHLNSRIGMCGYESPDKSNYFWHGLKRGNSEFILWQYTVSGAGELVFENQHYLIKPGQAMLLKIPHDHYYQIAPQSEKWELAFIILRGSECIRIGEEIINCHGPVSPFYSTAPVLEQVEKIMNYKATGNASEQSVMAYSFIMQLTTNLLNNKQLLPEPLKNARKYALNHFSENIQANDLASVVNMSYAHFSREFTRYFHISPGAYILQLQFEKAVNLLQNSSKNIMEIAGECGFSSTSYFCRAFRHKFNISPSNFRKQ